jgi:Phage integrase family
MAHPPLRFGVPKAVNRTVGPKRPPNRDLRTREYLTEGRGSAAKGGGQGQPVGPPRCDHDPRGFAGCRTRRPALGSGRVQDGYPACPQGQTGYSSTHPILGDELRALRRLQREQVPKSPFVFTSERGASFSPPGFARMIERAGAQAKFGFKAHPHMLRHACGYALANKGHDTRALQAYLGHKNIQHTVRYTELTPTRFKDFWRR